MGRRLSKWCSCVLQVNSAPEPQSVARGLVVNRVVLGHDNPNDKSHDLTHSPFDDSPFNCWINSPVNMGESSSGEGSSVSDSPIAPQHH
jgi:hypothetical protein